MATCSFSAANIVVFSEKQGQNVYFQHYNANILGWRIANLPKLRLFFQNYQKIAYSKQSMYFCPSLLKPKLNEKDFFTTPRSDCLRPWPHGTN